MKKDKTILSPHQMTRIEEVVSRLRNSVSELTIRNWLDNFRPQEFDMALTIIEHLKYFTIDEIIREFDSHLKSILRKYPTRRKYSLLGLGEFAKSGTTLIYFVRQTPTFRKNEDKFQILTHPRKLLRQGIREGDILILVDDILGSGGSFTFFYTQELSSQFLKSGLRLNILIMCLVYMEHASEKIDDETKISNIFGTENIKAFASGTSVFGYRPKMLPIRELAYRYGKDLFTMTDRSTQQKIYHPLGFMGSQALVVFAHSVPNNTLPIIWSSQNGWYPLYPRSANLKIDRLKQFKKESWLEFTFGMSNRGPATSRRSIYNNRKNFALFSIIKLKRRRSIVPIICQILGLTFTEFEELKEEGKRKGLFDANGDLTSLAIDQYAVVMQSQRIQETEDRNSPEFFAESEIYLPKTFLGKT